MSVERVSLIFIMIAMLFQEIRIISLRSRINYCERRIKSLTRASFIQNRINHLTTEVLQMK